MLTIFENTAKTFVQPLPCLSRSIVGLNVRFAPGSSNILIFDKNFSPNQIFALERSDSPEEVVTNYYYYYETSSSTTPTVRKRTKPKRKTMETIFEVLNVRFAPRPNTLTPQFTTLDTQLEEEIITERKASTKKSQLCVKSRRLTHILSKRTRSGASH